MRGRETFTVDEIHRIETALRQASRAEPRRRDALHRLLRRDYRFYVSDFARRRRLTSEDIEELIAQGVIRVRFR